MPQTDLIATVEGRAELSRRAREHLAATEREAEELHFSGPAQSC